MTAWAVDLAPQHKLGLPLPTRVVLAAGMVRLGFPEQIPCSLDGVGAVVTGPWTWEPHWGPYPVLVERPGGVFWVPQRPGHHVPSVLERAAAAWEPLPTVVLAAIAAGEVAHTEQVARHLADIPAVAGVWVEIGAEEEMGHALARVTAAGQASGLPVIAVLPLHRAAALAEPCLHAGADALVVGMPPEGEWPHEGRWVRGRVYGPLLLPLTLAALRAVLNRVQGRAPVLAQGGIHSPEDAVLCRAVGAAAVVLDAAVWVVPDMPAQVWAALRAWEEEHALSEEADDASGHSTGK